MRKQWRCFHCDEVFLSHKLAQEHFGDNMQQKPACRLTIAEGNLVTYIRKLERELERYRKEDSDVLHAYQTLESQMSQSVRRAEEEGYAKGLRDAKM